jgi:suppressor for copper-sensitivity B
MGRHRYSAPSANDRGTQSVFKSVRGILAALLMLVAPATALAAPAASDWAESPEASARIVSATTTVGDLGELRLGLEIRLAPGWKTYWRSPGDGGLPPELNWNGSENVASAEIGWPAPERFEILGIDSVGYRDRVIYPITLTPGRPGEPISARLSLDYLTCEQICVPQHAVLSLHLPAGPASASQYAFEIDRARGRIPGPGVPGFDLTGASLRHGVDESWWLELSSDGVLQSPDAFIEAGEANFGFGAPEQLGPTLLRLPVLYSDVEPTQLAGEPVTVTLTDGSRALERTLTVTQVAAATTSLSGWLLILATAFLGGAILNLMPCVLPVLSIKLMGAIKLGGASRRTARASFLATTAGIITSFAVLAAAAIALKAAGTAVGWGMQFQDPVFIGLMTFVCVLFAANLWGFFEVPMPGFLGQVGGGYAGAFGTGVFATLLATPCSAPFVGTAIAFALSRGVPEVAGVFLAMGLGLALPYMVVAVWPRLVTRLPRPGRWMRWLRIILGFALAVTAAWLLSVMLGVAGPVGAGVLAALSIGLLLWLWRAPPWWRPTGAAIAIITGLLLPVVLQGPAPPPRTAVAASVWQPFSQERLARLVADGKTVLVDVTADWCITCQANKATVLDRGEVARRLNSDTIGLRADWTRPDPAIQAYLASFNRYGIPLNIVYGPGAPAGITLPELLTEDAVLDALRRAASTNSAS